ncbi:MAG: hypothetical protein L6R41_003683 [Letrouitia leprolyta]|nr:MAG: hypothetical protein L6R41_003683 [Letrouitia leprolyta]
MPAEGIPLSPSAHSLATPEIVYLSELFVKEGVNKIRLTGGEPTVRKDILPLMHEIGRLRSKGLKELCLTTNGISLHRKLDAMVEAGLTGVNLSLDTLDPYQFQLMTRRKGFDAVIKSLNRLLDMNRLGAGIKLKLNTVVMRGVNEREIVPFVEMGKEHDIEVRFIEYMPFDGNKWSRQKMLSYKEMVEIIRQKYPDLCRVQEEGKNETSKTWQVPGFKGKVGFITSMTENFCGTCNRLRITSDGNLKVCLFGNSEVSLRDLLRKDNNGEPIDWEAIEAMKQIEMGRQKGNLEPLGYGDQERKLLDVIGMAVKRKKERHAGMGQLENMKNRPMILIGGTSRNHRQLATPLLNNVFGSPLNQPTSLLPSQGLYMSPATVASLHTSSDGSIHKTKWGAKIARKAVKKNTLLAKQKRQTQEEVEDEDNPSMTSGPPVFSPVSTSTTSSKPPSPFPPRQPPPKIQLPFTTTEPDTLPPTPSTTRNNNHLPHLTPSSEVHQISISHKPPTPREAIAIGTVRFSNPNPISLIKTHSLEKGDVLSVARIAGIMAIKNTSTIIPLAHNCVPVEGCEVDVFVVVPNSHHQYGAIEISVRVQSTGKTGVEMEALAGVMGAALTVVDMCKGVDMGCVVEGVRVLGKRGVRSGAWGIYEE